MIQKLILLVLPLFLAFNLFAQGSVSDVLDLTNEAQTLYEQKQYKKAFVKINNAISILEGLEMDAPSRVLDLKEKIKTELDKQKSTTVQSDKREPTAIKTSPKKNTSYTDSAQLIIDKYIDATGGTAAWNNIYGLNRKWKSESNGIIVILEMTHLKNGNYIITSETSSGDYDFKYTFAYDGYKSWYKMSSVDGIKYSEEDEQKNQKIRSKDGLNPYVDYKEKGTKITYVGTEYFNNQECYKLKVKRDSLYSKGKRIPNETQIWINKQTNLLVGEEYQMTSAKNEVYTYTYSDYRWVGNVRIPFVTANNIKDNDILTTYEEITVLTPSEVTINFSPH
ncbi:hypothetical protein [Lishizhenia sp.]|uniref:hypothetical protein n=1 Tax=Lishizhenia sp. TaxID=2497594 RepID=UPI00299EB3FB|nr:hypothetical protein [Lishizhenia sp.]MDX1445850.1 hypothetical protein [Lishizhenia sp.]